MEGVAAAVFYVALVATIAGAVVFARGAVERDPSRNRLGAILLAVGFVGLAISIALFVTGPRRMLPF